MYLQVLIVSYEEEDICHMRRRTHASVFAGANCFVRGGGYMCVI